MSSLESNNKRIAKNTILLYLRMLLTIVVGLYTSRVVLNTLGVSDYGVYNVVGGIVAMLSFLNSALTAASQRFISFELGRGDKDKLKTIFCTSVTIHAILAIIIFIIAETVGLWFVNTHLNIEPTRMTAANWVYQCSILTFMLTIVSVPYNSCIVAHEHMNAFAYVSILEVILKLLIVFLLLVINYDKLIIVVKHMDRITFILIALLVWILTIILVIVVLNLINNKEKKKLKAEIEKLEKEKNMVISASMLSELNKVEALVNNDEIKKFDKKIKKSIDFFIVKILKNFAFKRKILNFQRTII